MKHGRTVFNAEDLVEHVQDIRMSWTSFSEMKPQRSEDVLKSRICPGESLPSKQSWLSFVFKMPLIRRQTKIPILQHTCNLCSSSTYQRAHNQLGYRH